jgi:DNA-directed RNA polymerase subunit beta
MINVKEQKLGQNVRMSFSKSRNTLELPNLVEIQTKSFRWFVEEGLGEVLRDVSPITDYSGNLQIDFIDYSLDSKPKYTIEECKERDANYAAPLKVNVRLTNKQTGEVKQTDIFMGEFPIMTETGTFVINGAERVIVSQIIRSPGMYYADAIDKSGKETFNATIIPYRGAWLEYEIDASGVVYVRIDKTRKLPLTMFVRALGVESREDIYALFGDEELLAAGVSGDLVRYSCGLEAAEDLIADLEAAIATI